MNISDLNKDRCSGCTACESICPKNAIKMTEDECGFLYPAVDSAVCIDCGLCSRVCPFKQNYSVFDNFPESEVYAVKEKENDRSLGSSSGGAGYFIAQEFIKNGGTVYGVGVNEEFEAAHICVEKADEVCKICGSKYVQSKLSDTFDKIKKATADGKKILFIGTACQTAGLRMLLPDCKGLYTVDVLCHGVPSPRVFKEFLKYLEQKKQSKVKRVVFRSKENGWIAASSGQEILFENGDKCKLSLFFKLFFDHTILRPSCSSCVFTTLNKPSDMTIADFWAIKRYDSEFYTPNGVSMVLTNSEKGREMFAWLKERAICKKYTIACCEADQFKKPAAKNNSQKCFFDFEAKHGYKRTFEYYNTKYAVNSIMNRIKRAFKVNK